MCNINKLTFVSVKPHTKPEKMMVHSDTLTG